ncbi:GNAT family N-acetyltransferase [Hymenobacter elongatus]|uniref:N-acetyltransferase n=1 Tax=Hymenobacter elongatus TaxID=877208 RepID=A0A4Z0PH23_9BACT|nr:GNAT family protein [Hymenobacter elongatus]TGE14329.1 N-acetyltransferase [Hymenobacter elongatus]
MLKLHRRRAVTDCLNYVSVRLLAGVGMRREVHFCQNIWFEGVWGDEYVYAMLGEERLVKATINEPTGS